MDATNRTLLIRRTDGRVDPFVVHVGRYTTLLDALEEIRSDREHSLLYRHSCHHGSCGTCGVSVNGEPALACLCRLDELDEPSTVEPLGPSSVLGDLAVDPAPLYEHFPPDAGYLRPSDAQPDAVAPTEVGDFTRFESCIECGLCVAACPVRRPFLGPAALAAYGRELEKHPERESELMPAIDTPEGIWGCERALACSAICPLGVAPARHIAVLRRKAAARREDDSSPGR